MVRRSKTGKGVGSTLRTVRGFSPTDCIPTDVLPFSLDRADEGFVASDHVSSKALQVDESMSAELRVARAIKRIEIALDEITTVAPESFPNPEISARLLEGIFNFMRKKLRFSAWLEVLRVCHDQTALTQLYNESFEYLVHTLPKEMEENVTVFTNFNLADRLDALIKTIKSTPKCDDLSKNRVFQFLLVDFEMLTAPPHMFLRPVSLRQFHQVTYYISMLGIVCALSDGDNGANKYIMGPLERETHRALALLRYDFDIWSHMVTSSKALEISQRKDVDFERFGLLPESAKAASLVNLDALDL